MTSDQMQCMLLDRAQGVVIETPWRRAHHMLRHSEPPRAQRLPRPAWGAVGGVAYEGTSPRGPISASTMWASEVMRFASFEGGEVKMAACPSELAVGILAPVRLTAHTHVY